MRLPVRYAQEYSIVLTDDGYLAFLSKENPPLLVFGLANKPDQIVTLDTEVEIIMTPLELVAEYVVSHNRLKRFLDGLPRVVIAEIQERAKFRKEYLAPGDAEENG